MKPPNISLNQLNTPLSSITTPPLNIHSIPKTPLKLPANLPLSHSSSQFLSPFKELSPPITNNVFLFTNHQL